MARNGHGLPMYKDRQEISTGEYDLPYPNDSPPASEPSPCGRRGGLAKAGVFLALHCARAILAACGSTLWVHA